MLQLLVRCSLRTFRVTNLRQYYQLVWFHHDQALMTIAWSLSDKKNLNFASNSSIINFIVAIY